MKTKKFNILMVSIVALAMICLSVHPAFALSIDTNTGMSVSEGSSGNGVTSAMLSSSDGEDGPPNVKYTVDVAPSHGTLKLIGVALSGGSTFTPPPC